MSRRIQRVEELIKQQVAELLREFFSEKYGIITVTFVKVAADLKTAQVKIIPIDKNIEEMLMIDINEKTPEIQRTINQKLQMKFIPKIEFSIDEDLEKINKIESLLGEINHES